MATLEELAKEYANKILKSTNRYHAIEEVIRNINSLTYQRNKQPINQDDINLLILNIKKYLKENLKPKRPGFQNDTFSKYRNNELLLENTDTSGLNEIINMITKGTEK